MPGTISQLENSEVFPNPSVAVAVKIYPPNRATPFRKGPASVHPPFIAVVVPRKNFP